MRKNTSTIFGLGSSNKPNKKPKKLRELLLDTLFQSMNQSL